jgi:hypothetical protein
MKHVSDVRNSERGDGGGASTNIGDASIDSLERLCGARLESDWALRDRAARIGRQAMTSIEQVEKWRAACADRSITREEYALAIAYLREGRLNSAPKPKPPKAPRKGKKSPTKPPASQVDLEDLINQLESL